MASVPVKISEGSVASMPLIIVKEVWPQYVSILVKKVGLCAFSLSERGVASVPVSLSIGGVAYAFNLREGGVASVPVCIGKGGMASVCISI